MDNEVAAPIFTPAALEAVKAFPIEARDLELVAVSENVTFRVTDAADGTPYVLRLHRPGYHDLASLNSERVWTRALAAAGIAVPVGVSARDGRDYVPVWVEALGEERQAGLASWTEGEILAQALERLNSAAETQKHFAKLGALMASMHNQASGWRPPAGFKRHAVDAQGLMGETPFWGPFWEHPAATAAQQRLLLATRDKVREAMLRYGKRDETYSVIHADLHPFNVLVGGEGLTVIDFDDAAFGWHQYDMAVALVHMQDQPGFAGIQQAFVAGYRTARPMSDADAALIPMFLMTRGMAQIGWLHQRPEIKLTNAFKRSVARVCAQCEAFEAPC